MGWFYLFPNYYVELSKSALSSISFISNIFFQNADFEYGDKEGLSKPLLHTWSLSVEEQFYIIIPLFIYSIYKFNNKSLVLFIVLITLISLILSNYFSINNPSFGFYSFFTRSWEIFAGILLAYLVFIGNLKNKFNDTACEIILFFGLLLIFLSILLFQKNTLHPSIFTLPIILGTCIVIFFSKKKLFITRLLSNKYLVYIGLISYSLYLWHYPIFSYARIYNFSQGILYKKFLLIIFLISISLISYYFIEKPFRNRNFNFTSVLKILFLLIFSIVTFNFFIIKNHGLKNRFYFSEKYSIDKKIYMNKAKNFEINYNYNDYKNIKKNVLIIGNSIAEDTLKILSKTRYKEDYYFNLTSPKERREDYNFQIEYFLNYLKNKKTKIDGTKENFYNHLHKQYLSSNILIFSTRWSKDDIMSLDQILNLVKKDNKKIIVLGSIVKSKLGPLNLNRLDSFVFKRNRLPNNQELIEIEKKLYSDLKNNLKKDKLLKKILKNHSIKLTKTSDIYCNNKNRVCPVLTDNNYKIYYDYGHITDEGANFFAQKYNKNNYFNF